MAFGDFLLAPPECHPGKWSPPEALRPWQRKSICIVTGSSYVCSERWPWFPSQLLTEVCSAAGVCVGGGVGCRWGQVFREALVTRETEGP